MRQKPDRKPEIYQKALDLFAKNGYDGTSMSMIADTLGMSKANLYYYYSTKEELLFQTHLDFLQKHFIPILDEAEMVPDPAARVALFLRKFTLLNTSNHANRILIHEVNRLNRNHQLQIILISRRAYELVRDSIKELQRSGRALKCRESFLAFMWVGMASWVVYWFDYGRQSNAEELADVIVRTFLNSLIPEAPRATNGVKNKDIFEQKRRESGKGIVD